MGMESENLTERFVAAVNSRTAEENARIMGVPVEDLLRAGFVDTPAGTERRQREFFRDLNDGARDGWRSVSLDHWVLLDGDNVMAWVSRVYQGADGEWGWRVARCNGGTDVMVQPCEGTSGDPETLAGAKAAAEAAMSLGSAYDLGLSRAWGQRWEAQRERVRETVRAHIVQAAWATVKTSRADADRLAEYLQASQPTVEFVADPADAVRLCMNAVAAAQDALATARAAVEHAVKLGAGETLRAIVSEAVERIGEAVAAPGALQEAQRQLVQAHEDIDAMRAEAVTRGDALRLLGWVTDAAPKAWAESVREHVATHVWTAGSSEASRCTRCGVSQHGAREAPTCADGFRLGRDRAYALATSKQAELDAVTDRLTFMEAERLRWTKCGEDPETAAADMRAMWSDQQSAHGLRAVLRIGHAETEFEQAREVRRLADLALSQQARPEVQAALAEIRKAARSCLVGLGWEPARLSLIGL